MVELGRHFPSHGPISVGRGRVGHRGPGSPLQDVLAMKVESSLRSDGQSRREQMPFVRTTKAPAGSLPDRRPPAAGLPGFPRSESGLATGCSFRALVQRAVN